MKITKDQCNYFQYNLLFPLYFNFSMKLVGNLGICWQILVTYISRIDPVTLWYSLHNKIPGRLHKKLSWDFYNCKAIYFVLSRELNLLIESETFAFMGYPGPFHVHRMDKPSPWRS